MTTAREQAREAVRHAPDRPGMSLADYKAECADAASDVWEPIVRDLVNGLRGQLGTNSEKVMAHNLQKAYRRAKEALG